MTEIAVVAVNIADYRLGARTTAVAIGTSIAAPAEMTGIMAAMRYRPYIMAIRTVRCRRGYSRTFTAGYGGSDICLQQLGAAGRGVIMATGTVHATAE